MYSTVYGISFSLPKFNLPRKDAFTWFTPPRPYRTTTCLERGLNSGPHTFFFFDHTRTWSASPDEESAQCRGPPPRQNEHERRYTSFTHPFILTRRIWKDDYDAVFGDIMSLKLPKICLTGEENPRDKPHPRNLSRPGIEPGPAAWQARIMECSNVNKWINK